MVQHKVIDNREIASLLKLPKKEMLEKLVLHSIEQGSRRVIDIIDFVMKVTEGNVKKEEIIDTIKRMDNKVILLYYPKKNFVDYIKNFYQIYILWVIIIISTLTIITIYNLPNIIPWNGVRIIIGGIFVLFTPGYALIYLLFPRKERDILESIALSIGTSIAIISLIGFLLNYSPWGITLDPIVISLSIVSIVIAFSGVYRSYLINKRIIEDKY